MGLAIVVDTSVAVAVSEKGKGESQVCRLVLKAILRYDFYLAMSKPLHAEWMQTRPDRVASYASLYAVKWYTLMKSRGRVKTILLEEHSSLRQQCLQTLQNHPQTANIAVAVEKDFHLVETDLKSDHRVISLDRKIVKHLPQLKEVAEEICLLLWVHPIEHQAVAWLRSVAPEREDCRIC